MEKELEIKFDFKNSSEKDYEISENLRYGCVYSKCLIDLKDYIDIKDNEKCYLEFNNKTLYINNNETKEQKSITKDPNYEIVSNSNFMIFVFENNNIYRADIILDYSRIGDSEYAIFFRLAVKVKRNRKNIKSYMTSLITKIIKNNTFKIVYTIKNDIYK